MPHNEIERKFLIDIETLPYDLSHFNKLEIEQTYLSSPKNARIRKITNTNEYYLTTKNDLDESGLSREEIEVKLTKEEFNSYLKNKIGSTIFKDRYKIPYNQGLTLEIDIYKKQLKGLFIMEIEFNTTEAAISFVPPDWIVREVTSNPHYKNSSLALNGLFS